MLRWIEILKALADPLRLRLLLVLMEKEMCVCQLMAVLRVSQPMVSRSLAILQRAGLLKDRKERKLKFYRLNEDMDEECRRFVMLLKEALWDDETFVRDRHTVVECTEFQKKTGRCDMKALKEFMEKIKGGAI
jgi:ArsR family transcriptional regulator